jgi:hypothetical protein
LSGGQPTATLAAPQRDEDETMTIIDLPAPVQRYLDADASADDDKLAQCFTADARVLDEGRTIQGVDAIKAWKSASRTKYRYSVEPLSATLKGACAHLTARVSGSFPGSPAELDYRFELRGQRIAELEIG